MDLLWFAFAFLSALAVLTLLSHERQRRIEVRKIEEANAAIAAAQAAAEAQAEAHASHDAPRSADAAPPIHRQAA